MATDTLPTTIQPTDLIIDLTPLTGGCCAPATSLRWSMEEAEHLASMLKALAHPVRLQMVELLHRLEGQVCVCDLEAHFDLTQPTISHHLKVLRQAGIISGFTMPRGPKLWHSLVRFWGTWAQSSHAVAQALPVFTIRPVFFERLY
jgi:hypothetical protein